MRTKNDIIRYSLLILVILILVNILSDKLYLRLDLTSDHRYTLSKATRTILKNLTQPVTLKAYFSKDLPPEIEQVRSDLRDLLVEYASISRGKLVYEFIDPNKDDATEQEAAQNGIQPVIINSREKDKAMQKRAYLGLVIKMGERSETVPFVQPGSAMEYAVSSSIKKLSVTHKPLVGILQGQGEPELSSMPQVIDALSVLYDVEPVTLSDTANALERFNTLAIVAPADSFKNYQLQQLDQYIKEGKNLLLAINRVGANLNEGVGQTINTGLEEWLSKKGISIDNNFVLDENCASIGIRQQQGMFSFTSSITFPYMPIATTFANHPITTGLGSVLMQFASTVSSRGDSGVQFTPIVKTSKKSAIRPSPVYFDLQHQWTEDEFPLSELTVGAVAILKNDNGKPARLVVFGDGDFPVNGTGEQALQLSPDNVNLFVNSIDWLSDDTGLIQLRTKGMQFRPLEQISDSSKLWIKWLNFILPIFIILVYGFFRSQRNKNIRRKRMEEGYV